VEAISTIKAAREAIALAMVTTTHAARTFRRGASSGGVYSTDQEMKKEQREALIEAIRSIEDGQSGGAYRNLLLWGGVKYTHRSFAPDQAQLQQVAVLFRIRNPCLQGVDKAPDRLGPRQH
jgi:phage portal protein BeeE